MTTTKTAVACPEPDDRAQAEIDDRESERGLATAEYAIATIAAAGFAGVLMVILRGGDVKSMLTSLVQSALTIG
ncbi:DUF4244 domain-containing protein [Promicromonospora sp. NPDC023805]|uniref:DUF4244 domain-containing protein n=1 Tax=Promicromonospora sp. NPDC023805 TaxID=3154696 RepID=UPI0033C03D63